MPRGSSISLKTGLGLRRELVPSLKAFHPPEIDFLEIAPENWAGVGGTLAQELCYFREHYPLICHGIGLSLGGTDPLNTGFLKQVKKFLKENHISYYSEHLSFSGSGGHLYDLFPLPFTFEAVRHVSRRIRKAQEILERKIAVENISYYAVPGKGEMSELDFLKAVLEEADCRLLLDVNNVYVNALNHGYDAENFIQALSTPRIAYLHMAGHYRKSKTLLIDTHGADVIQPVWKLLRKTYEIHGILPTLLERDFHIPPLSRLLKELRQIRKIQNHAS